jgi:hypothetical protein
MIGVTKVLQSLCQPQEEDLSTSDTTDQGATTDDAKAGHQAQPPNESNIAKLMGGFQRQLLVRTVASARYKHHAHAQASLPEV